MANKKYEETDIQAIADTIREKTGSEDSFKVRDMANGVNEVYEAGKFAEQRAFWEELTNNGAKRRYFYTFCEVVWNKNNFRPTCNIVPTEADHTFHYHNRDGNAYDLAQHLEDLGVVLDMSNCTLGNYTFENAVFSRLPELNMTKGTFTCFVRNCKSLVTIDKIIIRDAGDQNFTQTFNACNVLKNITFEGTIGRSISFPNSPLSVASMKNIISHLANYKGTENEGVYTVSFTSACKTKLEAEGNTSPNGNSWLEYLDDIGWDY